MRRLLPVFLPLLLAVAAPAALAGDSWDLSADLAVQTRLFTDDARWFDQSNDHAQVSLQGRAEFRWRGENQRASIIPFARWDIEDSSRNLLDLPEAYWAFEGRDTEVLIGANTVFWGVTESVHLVDIVNQTDAAGDIDGEDKLGQPMVNVTWQADWGELSAFVMPLFRERSFPGAAGRLRTPLPIDTGRPRYGSSEGKNHVDVALRYSHYFGDVDLGLSVFSGTSREPRLLPNDDFTRLIPHYDQIDQAGLDLQYTREAWLWKLETIVRNGYADTFAAAVGGLEYTFFQISDTAADVGLLIEYQYDGRGPEEPLTIADNDLFLGTRLALNDTQDSTMLAGVVYDVDTSELFFNLEAERRIGDSFVLELRARAFSGADPADVTYSLSADDYVQLQFSKFF